MSALVFDISKLLRLKEKIAFLDKTDKKALLESVGAEVESQTQHRLVDEKAAPDGTPWPAWSQKYQKTREAHHNLLQSEGDLATTITANPPTNNSIEIGSHEIYSNTHQFGDEKRGIPQRQFLGLSPQNISDIQALIELFLQNHLRKIG